MRPLSHEEDTRYVHTEMDRGACTRGRAWGRGMRLYKLMSSTAPSIAIMSTVLHVASGRLGRATSAGAGPSMASVPGGKGAEGQQLQMRVWLQGISGLE